MKKIKEIIKNNIVGFIIGVIIAITISAYAATTLQSSAVYYDNSKSGGTSNTVAGAIDELYEKTKTTDFKVGDYVKMTPSSTSFTIPSTLTGYESDQTINPSELNLWRVIRVNSNKTVDMVSEYVSSTNVHFTGKTGYINYIGTLNYIAKQYENRKYTTGSRHMGYNGQTEYITNTTKIDQTTAPWNASATDNTNEALGGGDVLYQTDTNLVKNAIGTLVPAKLNTGDNNSYYIASRTYALRTNADWWFGEWWVRGATGGVEIGSFIQKNSTNIIDTTGIAAVRPIIILKSKIKASSGNGTSASPYVLN